MLGLLVTIGIPLIAGIALIALAKKKFRSYDDTGDVVWGVGAVTAAIAVIVLVVVYPCCYFCSMDTVAEMEAFQKHTMSAYEYTISETQEIEISAAAVGLIDVAYLEQGKQAGSRLQELRDKIEWFNRNLCELERHNAHWLLDDFTYDLPKDLVPITIK